jgi:hypothetical protein
VSGFSFLRFAAPAILLLALMVCAFPSSAQIPDPNAQQKLPPPPGQTPPQESQQPQEQTPP